ncbi:MAG: TlpA family protein disulfide reductase, partial [Acidobacteria bacterium]|nr:TlpA family protein disulfide reductase [Acidobacteriota bacterium]
EMPWFIDFQQKYGARGFTMVGLAMDEEGRQVVAPWIEKKRFDVNGTQTPVNYPILLGNDKVADQFGGLIGLPTSLLISRDGKILKRFIGLVGHDTYAKAIEDNL